MSESFERAVRVAAPIDVVFDYHRHAEALERLTPPWQPLRVLERRGGIEDGGTLRLALGPLLRWQARHTAYERPQLFRDEQLRGPFARWVHTHAFEELPAGGTRLTDQVDYELPFGRLGRWLAGRAVAARLERLFEYRQQTVRMDCERLAWARAAGRFRIAMSGASGFIGKALARLLRLGGHTVVPLVRSEGEGIRWDPERERIDARALEGFDAIVHLSGEPVAAQRWTPAFRARLLEGRARSTRVLAQAIGALSRPPRVFLCASGVGYYGSRGDEPLDESSASGSGLLAEVCRRWEAASEVAGVRTVRARLGIVLSPRGGPLRQMAWPFHFGVGGPFGDGTQFMAWVTLDDAVGALHHALFDARLEGALNVVAPEPVRNRDFAAALGLALGRPAVIGAPAFLVRTLLGREMAEELLLSGQRATPAVLLDAGFRFSTPTLPEALERLYGRAIAARS